MPEKFIWRVGIALHCLPRVLVVPYSLHKHFKNTQAGRKYNLKTWWFWVVNLTASVLHLAENGALITLTYISSTDNYGKIQCIIFNIAFCVSACCDLVKVVFLLGSINNRCSKYEPVLHPEQGGAVAPGNFSCNLPPPLR